ncbi:hypothetical protein [Bacillus taeanensis]|uniref:Uncharacterized protein n=1 Tax=Bacillus taeanensis TaxID=273032 RepID=A0A366XTV6_9BACI|nr:hypothetical protein [Bacillus taeanensis]RBW68585.1 hypothetical protein DS031_15600 [Bacillus taeanensis]
MDKFLENLEYTSKGTWYPIGVAIIVFLFMVFMHKRLSWRQNFFAFCVIGYMTWTIDVIVGSYIDVFDLGKKHSEGIGEFVSYAVIPESLYVIYLNYLKQEKKWLYALFFTVLSFLFEWGLVKVGYMKLTGWRTWYTIPVYFGVFGFILPWLLQLLRREFSVENKKQNI